MTIRTCSSPASALARSAALIMLCVLGSAAAQPVQIALVRSTEQAGLVDIRRLAPDIELDLRYASGNNFTGRPVPGYDAPKCFLLKPAASALAKVEADLRANGYGLRLFDCYRPAQAVRAFVDWANDPLEQSRKAQQYPGLEKQALLGGYIAESSGHSRGATVDLTLVDCRSGSCTALDMGTDFDFFGPRAHTDASEVTVQQYNNRQKLRQAMVRQGFANYPLEWWHYTLSPEPDPHTAYDVPVR